MAGLVILGGCGCSTGMVVLVRGQVCRASRGGEAELGVVSLGCMFIVDLLGPTIWSGQGRDNVFHDDGENRCGIMILRGILQGIIDRRLQHPNDRIIVSSELNVFAFSFSLGFGNDR